MNKLYKQYFQKSKVFIYPLLGIKKGVRFVPVQTYMSWNGYYTKDMNKFLCLYNVKENKAFNNFEKLYLQTHNDFDEYHKIDDENHLYIFNISRYNKDLELFYQGQYSEFSQRTKNLITNFFGETGTIAEYIESFLYPEHYYEDYAEMLDVDLETIMNVKELCDKPDLKKEDLKKDFVNVELFK